jgi:8-oxo-dGTP pyrophosphatase MutT (NUDIX family)
MPNKPKHLRWRTEVAATHPAFASNWHSRGQDVALVNEKLGAIWHVVVCAPDGTPIHDQPVWSEPAGAVIVATDEEGRIGFVRNFRVAMRDPGSDWATLPKDFDGYGRVSLELPRGFPEPGEAAIDAARREAEEELGVAAGPSVLIGWHNSNTTYYASSIPIFQLSVSSTVRSRALDDNESIESSCFLTLADALERVRRGEILCGITKSALLTYLGVKPEEA